MLRPSLTLALSAFMCSAILPAAAQRCAAGATLNVRIVMENSEQSAGSQLRVQLLHSGGDPQAESMTSAMGDVQFARVPVGMYKLRVTGPGIQTTEGLPFSLSCVGGDQSETLRVRADESKLPGGVISASQINIPDNARREMEKGNHLATNNHLEDAAKHFEKAVAIFPRYALAYNNLGVVYMKLGRPADGRSAFLKALAADARCAQAHTNMGKMFINARQFVPAEGELEQAIGVDVRSVEAFTLLAMAQLMNGKYAEAAENAHRAHTLGDQGYSVGHYVAAQAWQAQQRNKDAVIEYEWYLRETPQGSNADNARKALAGLHASAAVRTEPSQ